MTDEKESDVYEKEYKASYDRLLEATTTTAHKVAKAVYETWLRKPYNAKLDIDAFKANVIAENIAKEVADSFAEIEAVSKSYGLENDLDKNR